MAVRKLEVQIVGDERGLSRALDRSQKKTSKFGGVAKKAMTGVGLAAGGAAIGIKKVTDAAGEAEKSQARLKAQLNASGISFRKHSGEIERVIQKTSKLAALDDEDLQDAFTNIVRTTGNVNKSLRLVGVAADFARGKQIDVAKAGEILAKVAGGNVGILSRYGVTVEKGATATEALAALQKKFAGQADAYGKTSAGAQDRLRVSLENLQEAVGAKLAPTLARVTNSVNTFLNQMVKGTGAGGRFRDTMTGVAGNLQRVGQAIAPVLAPLASFAGALVQSKTAMTALALVATGLVARLVALKVAAAVAVAMTALTKALAFVKVALLALRAPMLAIVLLMNANPISAVVIALAALGAALVVAYKKSETFRTVVNTAFTVVKTAVATFVSATKTYFGTWIKVFQAVVGAVRFGVATMLRIFDKWLGGFSTILSAAGKIPGIGGKFRAAARGIDEAREKLRGTADAIEGVRKKKDTKVTVTLKMAVAGVKGQVSPFGGRGEGSPRNALERAIAATGQSYGAAHPGIFGPMPGEGGLLGGSFKGGTYKKANAIARRFGLRVSSGWRSPSHNAAVGGVPNSLHTHGSAGNPGAIDLVGPTGAMYKALAYARSNIKGLKEALVHNVGSGLHLHLGFFRKGGMIGGSGSGDTVPAMLEPGEGVINRKAVAAMGGKRAIDSLNAAVPRFASGGVVARAAHAAGFRGKTLLRMVAEAKGESGWNERAVGDGGKSKGLWQIHTGFNPWAGRLNLFDPFVNARAAYRIYRSQGVGAWHANHAPHMGAAARAIASMKGKAGKKGSRVLTMQGGRLAGQLLATEVDPRYGGQKGIPYGGNRRPRPLTVANLDGAGDPGGSDGPSGPSPAEQLAATMDALREQIAGLRDETRANTAVVNSSLAISHRTILTSMTDMIAGELGTMGAQRGRTPGTGQMARY